MQALAMSSVPSKRFTNTEPSASKRPKMEKSNSNPYMDAPGRGLLPDWAANNKPFPPNPMGRPLMASGSMSSLASNPSSRPSSAGSSINVSQEIDLGLVPANEKGKKDTDTSKLDVDSMMDATAYGGVDLKVLLADLNDLGRRILI